MKTKQVLVIRRDLKLRRGKESAQLAHSSLAVFFNLIKDSATGHISEPDENGERSYTFKSKSEALYDFFMNRFRKIVVYVNSEQELLDVYNKAKEKGMLCSLIKDAGLTELKEPTFTSVCVGPDLDDKVDEVTGHLPLY